MTDYDKIIKFLRVEPFEMESEGLARKMNEAADAIEELLSERDEVNADSWKTAFEVERDEHRWIPVTERLPEDDVRYVLCCGAKGGMFVGWVATRTYDGGDKATAFVHGGNGRNITHWMPLPEPPKGE